MESARLEGAKYIDSNQQAGFTQQQAPQQQGGYSQQAPQQQGGYANQGDGYNQQQLPRYNNQQ